MIKIKFDVWSIRFYAKTYVFNLEAYAHYSRVDAVWIYVFCLPPEILSLKNLLRDMFKKYSCRKLC